MDISKVKDSIASGDMSAVQEQTGGKDMGKVKEQLSNAGVDTSKLTEQHHGGGPSAEQHQAAPGDDKGGDPTPAAKPEKERYPGDSFLGSYGNNAGNKVQSALGHVGDPVGKGLETAARPVGSLVDPLVGGLTRAGGIWGDEAGVGSGNQDKKKAAANAKSKQPVGGQEQNAGNPLGLSET